jgi:hypothetical protein
MRTYTREEVIKEVIEFAKEYNSEALALYYVTEEEAVAEVQDKIKWPEE